MEKRGMDIHEYGGGMARVSNTSPLHGACEILLTELRSARGLSNL
jgi:hypothetical protein